MTKITSNRLIHPSERYEIHSFLSQLNVAERKKVVDSLKPQVQMKLMFVFPEFSPFRTRVQKSFRYYHVFSMTPIQKYYKVDNLTLLVDFLIDYLYFGEGLYNVTYDGYCSNKNVFVGIVRIEDIVECRISGIGYECKVGNSYHNLKYKTKGKLSPRASDIEWATDTISFE